MADTGFLTPLLIALILAAGVGHVRCGLRRTPGRARSAQGTFTCVVDLCFHVLMSLAMVAMLWPALAELGGADLRAVQMCVFGGGVVWFLMTAEAGRPGWGEAASMAAMVWMLLVMGQTASLAGGSSSSHPAATHAAHQVQAAAVPGWFGAVTIGFVVLLVLAAVLGAPRWRRERVAQPERRTGSLAAAAMGSAMALSMLSLL